MKEEETGQERRKDEDQCEGRKLEFDTASPREKQIGLSPQLGSGDAYRPHLEKAFFSVDRITMKGTRKAKRGEQLFRFCYQSQPC